MSNKIYEKDNYLNTQIPFIFNVPITEFDMKSAGFSLIQEYHLLDDSEIDRLSRFKKETRDKEIGKMQLRKKYSMLTKDLKASFVKARELFFTINNIDPANVISIKKDAIFLLHPEQIKTTKVSTFIDFREKHTYTAYIQLQNTLEIYYSPSQTDVKGIKHNIDKHQDYMLAFIRQFCSKMETTNTIKTMDFIRRFIDRYKKRELDIGYYREFNPNSLFVTTTGETYEEYDVVEDLDVSYNFIKVLVKLAKIPL